MSRQGEASPDIVTYGLYIINMLKAKPPPGYPGGRFFRALLSRSFRYILTAVGLAAFFFLAHFDLVMGFVWGMFGGVGYYYRIPIN